MYGSRIRRFGWSKQEQIKFHLSCLALRNTPLSAFSRQEGRVRVASSLDRDPEGRINIGPLERFISDFIMDAVVMLQRLTNDIPKEANNANTSDS